MTRFATSALERLCCIDCGGGLEHLGTADTSCPQCRRLYLARDGIIEALGPLQGRNRIAAEFYDGPRFERFRFWELVFLWYVGGLRRARQEIIGHLPALDGKCLLEVGIGSGDNVALISQTVPVVGLDIARRRLGQCRARYPNRPVRLLLAAAEQIPLEDNSVDAVLCVGGFNFFSDHALALAEMVRVTRPSGRVVVADEVPDLYRYGWGHRLRIPQWDRRIMHRWFGAEFAEMVLNCQFEPRRLAEELKLDATVHSIWRGYGYCLVVRVGGAIQQPNGDRS